MNRFLQHWRRRTRISSTAEDILYTELNMPIKSMKMAKQNQKNLVLSSGAYMKTNSNFKFSDKF